LELTQTKSISCFALGLSRAGNGVVVKDVAYPDALELYEQGWLERHFEPDGEMSWW
jgi:hypothetical protein